MSGRRSRQKGKRGEREACEVVRDLWPNVRRKAMQARGGHEGADLENTGRYHVEVGVGNVNPRTKWEQADDDSAIEQVEALLEPNETHPKTPIALTRRTDGPVSKRRWLVTLPVEHFKDLVRRATTYDELMDELMAAGVVVTQCGRCRGKAPPVEPLRVHEKPCPLAGREKTAECGACSPLEVYGRRG